MTTALSARPRRALFLAATLVAAAAQAGDSSRYDAPHYYNGGGQLLLAVGGGVHALVTSPLGTLGSVSLRAGWSSAGRPSLELRGGVDVLLGSRRGLTVVAGGLWMPLGLGHRVFVGLGAEAGVLVPFDGRVVGFAARGGPLLTWRPFATYDSPATHLTVEPRETSRFQLELGAGDVVFTFDGAAAVAVGASLRAALRF